MQDPIRYCRTLGDGLIDGHDGLINVSLLPGGVDNIADGFVDGEQDYGSSPILADTDDDELFNGLEVANDSDQNDPGGWPHLADGDMATLAHPDGQINAADILIAVRLTLDDLPAQPLQLAHGEMNADVVIDMAGVFLIIRL